MYKVFIDNNILFIGSSQEFSSLEDHIRKQAFPLKRSELKLFHKLIAKEKFIFIEADNEAEEVLKELFSDYEKISAAGGIVQRNDEFLFIQRHGLWDIPKGKIETGESIEEGAIREIEEECGITGPVINRKLCDTYHTYFFKGKNVLKRTYWYLFDYTGDELLIPQEEEGITEVRWFKEREFDRILKNTYASIQDVILSMRS